jgi:hypothetical protein
MSVAAEFSLGIHYMRGFSCTDASAWFLLTLMKIKMWVDRASMKRLVHDFGAHRNTEAHIRSYDHLRRDGGVDCKTVCVISCLNKVFTILKDGFVFGKQLSC